jgi:hypothetical protein
MSKGERMTTFKSLRKLTVYSLATLICGAGQVALAHTGIKDKVIEGVAGYNAFTVTHGCATNEFAEGTPQAAALSRQNVIAVSVVFPNSANPLDSKVYKLDSKGIQIEELPDLSADIVGVNSGVGFTNMGIGLVAGGGTLFPNIIPAINPETKAIRGYHTWSGPSPAKGAELEEEVVSTTGLSPFKFGAIKFKPESCAKSLKVRIAVANWCKRGAASKKKADRLDVWIGHTTAKFADQLTMPRFEPYDATKEVPFWPTMTVTRDLVNNPLSGACGAGYDLAIEPTDNDIDAYLPIPVAKYPNGAPGGKFFE